MKIHWITAYLVMKIPAYPWWKHPGRPYWDAELSRGWAPSPAEWSTQKDPHAGSPAGPAPGTRAPWHSLDDAEIALYPPLCLSALPLHLTALQADLCLAHHWMPASCTSALHGKEAQQIFFDWMNTWSTSFKFYLSKGKRVLSFVDFFSLRRIDKIGC